MPYDTERNESEPVRISREVREEHRKVLLESMKKTSGFREFTQQDVKNCLAELVVLVQRRRPLNMAIRDVENSKGAPIANKLRQEIDDAERRIQFS